MKKIINIIAVALLLLVASSCGRKVTYEYRTYATLESSSYSFDEDVEEVTIPVMIYNPTGAEVQLAVSTIDGKAEEYKDFEIISPISGVLTFAPGETVQEILIGIIEHPNERTGSRNFSLVIESLTEGFDVGNVNTAKLTIKDLDHPLKNFIGIWTASTVGVYQGMSYSWEMVISDIEGDDTKLLVSDMCPFSTNYLNLKSVDGFNIVEATSDKMPDNQLKIVKDQYIGPYAEGSNVYDISLCGVDESGAYLDDIVLVLSNDGKLVVPRMWGCYVSAGGFFEAYPAGIVFTKK